MSTTTRTLNLNVELIPSTFIHKKRKTYNIYRPKIIVVSSSSIERIVGDFQTKDKDKALTEAKIMIQKLKGNQGDLN